MRIWNAHSPTETAYLPAALSRAYNRCTTRSRKILQFKHYCTDAPI